MIIVENKETRTAHAPSDESSTPATFSMCACCNVVQGSAEARANEADKQIEKNSIMVFKMFKVKLILSFFLKFNN